MSIEERINGLRQRSHELMLEERETYADYCKIYLQEQWISYLHRNDDYVLDFQNLVHKRLISNEVKLNNIRLEISKLNKLLVNIDKYDKDKLIIIITEIENQFMNQH